MNWDIAVPAITGLVGAVLGAVFRPWFEHRLKRHRQAEAKVVAENRSVREMVENRIAMSRKEMHFATAVGVLLDAKVPGEQAFREAILQSGPILAIEVKEFWKPALIEDEALTYMCSELDARIDTLISLTLAAVHDQPWEGQQLVAMLPNEDLAVSRIQSQIFERLGVLQW